MVGVMLDGLSTTVLPATIAALVMPVLGCVPTFAGETTALLGLTAVWGWFLYRLCLRTARWVLGGVTGR